MKNSSDASGAGRYDNGAAGLTRATIASFAAGLSGSVTRPGDPDYDTERSVWNGAHDRRPALIVHCADAGDVARTIALARSEDLPLAVRGGGHSIAGFSTADDAIVADLSRMKAIDVDPTARRVTAQAGCTWKDLDATTQPFGLAVTGGLVSSTGIAGLTVGGGIGWLMRHHGLTCDNLVGAEVVTADGELVHASAEQNPDLFWGLRGGGGNFGVVTSFEYQLHDVAPTLLSGLVFYPADEAQQVLQGYRAACAAVPDELTTLVNFTTAPPVPFLPESTHGQAIVAVGGCWSGASGAGEAALAPFRNLGTVVSDIFAENPYAGWQQALDPLYPRGLHNYFRSAFLRTADDESLNVLLDSFAGMPNGLTEIHLQHLGGAVGRVPADATAYAMREMNFIVNVVARTPGADGFGAVTEWARELTSRLGPDAAGYVNFTGEAEQDARSYPAETSRRLVALKDRYDPTNVFRLNQNVAPSS